MGNRTSYVLTEAEEQRASSLIEQRKKHLSRAYAPPSGFSIDPLVGPKPTDLTGENVKIGVVKDYRMTYIESLGPDLFYVHWLSDMEKLTSFETKFQFWYDLYWYHDSDTESPLHVDRPVIGGYYACFDEKNEKWYRCKMIEYLTCYDEGFCKEGKLVLMLCIDYGFHIEANTNVVYPLRQKYIDALPVQAGEGKLYNDDKHCTWKSSDITYFEEMNVEFKWEEKVKMFLMKYTVRHTEPYPALFEFVILGNQPNAQGETGAFDMNGKIKLPDNFL